MPSYVRIKMWKNMKALVQKKGYFDDFFSPFLDCIYHIKHNNPSNWIHIVWTIDAITLYKKQYLFKDTIIK